jgi:hypothetical protein
MRYFMSGCALAGFTICIGRHQSVSCDGNERLASAPANPRLPRLAPQCRRSPPQPIPFSLPLYLASSTPAPPAIPLFRSSRSSSLLFTSSPSSPSLTPLHLPPPKVRGRPIARHVSLSSCDTDDGQSLAGGRWGRLSVGESTVDDLPPPRGDHTVPGGVQGPSRAWGRPSLCESNDSQSLAGFESERSDRWGRLSVAGSALDGQSFRGGKGRESSGWRPFFFSERDKSQPLPEKPKCQGWLPFRLGETTLDPAPHANGQRRCDGWGRLSSGQTDDGQSLPPDSKEALPAEKERVSRSWRPLFFGEEDDGRSLPGGGQRAQRWGRASFGGSTFDDSTHCGRSSIHPSTRSSCSAPSAPSRREPGGEEGGRARGKGEPLPHGHRRTPPLARLNFGGRKGGGGISSL